ncbi:MAG: hypothetical protein KDB27_03055, partial [Planctomycetales bacterium]|nr:hypothetical protein [Planctomycetales bacterium]
MKNQTAVRFSQRMTLALAIVSIAMITGCGDAPSTIVLDNGKSTPMHVTLNEQHEIEIAPNTHKVISVGPGKHKFEITCDGES